MFQLKKYSSLALIALLASGCNIGRSSDQKCTFSVSAKDQDRSIISIQANSRLDLHANLDTCGDAEQALRYQFEWYYDVNGNGVLDGEEKKPFSLAADLSIVACFNEKGDHALSLKAVPIDFDAETLEANYTIRVGEAPPRSADPTCVADAIALVQNAGTILKPEDYTPFAAAATCLKEFTEVNVCRFDANYAAVVAMGIDFGGKATDRFVNRSKLSPGDLEDIFDNEISPMLDRITVVEQKAPADFVFLIDGKAEVEMFGNLSYLEGDERVRLILQGEHDMTDVHAFAGMLHLLKGGLDMLLAYDGVAQAILDVPRLDTINFDYIRKYFVEQAIKDEEFLTLGGADGKQGSLRLLDARGEFMQGLVAFRTAFENVQTETDDQDNDILRYWDCGADGICDCTQAEIDNQLCPSRDAVWPGPDEDGTEGNGVFDDGEPAGTSKFANPDFIAETLPADLTQLNKQITLIVENLRGPNELDLNALANAPVTILMAGVLLPVPEIRLSEWFLSPSDPRYVMPIYSLSKKDVIFDIESEPYDDFGYDGLADKDEITLAGRNPRLGDGLPDGAGFDQIKNPDPAWDNFDPFCNPYCNWTDGVDNDGDGLIDGDDVFRSGTITVGRDMGVEGNLVFDFVDLDGNLAHDVGETSEKFSDVGTMDFLGNLIGVGNGTWDKADVGHKWPSEGVGPRSYDRYDPADGITEDRGQRIGFYSQQNGSTPSGIMYDGLIDNFYFYYQDPTLSGALTFPDDVQSIEGSLLSDNAKLTRFVNKALELVESFGIRDGNAHPCGDINTCQ